MKHKLSFIVLGGSGSKIRQIHFSDRQAYALMFVVCLAAASLVYGAVAYISMRSEIHGKEKLERKLAHQNEEVVNQRRQIVKFAEEINALKERMVVLDQFEQQIRLLADIKQPGDTDGLFGVGGSAPEDLNPTMELHETPKHLVTDMHRQVKQLASASEKKENTLTRLIDHLEEQKNMMAHTPAIRPAQGFIPSRFDYRQSPFTGRREFHKGIDIANRHGTPIVATGDGVISFSGENGALGQVVVIDHGYGVVTRYAHVQKTLKKRGERVRRGDKIALMGNTGRSTGPHLHYEVRLNGVPVNPEKYILN